MKKFLLLLTIYTAFTIAAFAQWKSLATDATGDGSQGGATFLDCTQLEYMYDDMSDSIWFRVTVDKVLAANYGLNIVLNVDGISNTYPWIGGNKFTFNRVITAWVTSGTSGIVGVTDVDGWIQGQYTKLGANNIDISVDATNKTYTLGMKRTDIHNDTVLKATVIAATGSNQYWDDDVPNTGSGTLEAKPVSVANVSPEALGYDIFPNPAKGKLNITRGTAGTSADIHLYNSNGQIIYTGKMNKETTKLTIDVNGQAKGVYFLRMNTIEGSAASAIILN